MNHNNYSYDLVLYSAEKEGANMSSLSSRRLHLEHIELRAVEVVLTLLPAIDLPLDLKVIKNNLGIPHQLPPRFENACLYFGELLQNFMMSTYSLVQLSKMMQIGMCQSNQ